jgi:hypothetical protein
MTDERLNPKEKSRVSVKSSFIFNKKRMSKPGKNAIYNRQTWSLITETGLTASNAIIN